MNARPVIGVFDSGVGGLSVYRSLLHELPRESFIYLADNRFAPYGLKSRQVILERSRSISEFLIQQGAALIVVACNTATGAAISRLRRENSIPFVGVEPAVKPAALKSKTGHIGVLATEQTFKGEHFRKTYQLYSRSVSVHFRAGNGLVELVENGQAESQEARALLEQYLMPMVQSGIDQLVLGCTHFPFLIPLIREIVPPEVAVIDPAPAVARQTRKVMEDHGFLLNSTETGSYQFYSTGDTGPLTRMLHTLSLNHSVLSLTSV